MSFSALRHSYTPAWNINKIKTYITLRKRCTAVKMHWNVMLVNTSLSELPSGKNVARIRTLPSYGKCHTLANFYIHLYSPARQQCNMNEKALDVQDQSVKCDKHQRSISTTFRKKLCQTTVILNYTIIQYSIIHSNATKFVFQHSHDMFTNWS